MHAKTVSPQIRGDFFWKNMNIEDIGRVGGPSEFGCGELVPVPDGPLPDWVEPYLRITDNGSLVIFSAFAHYLGDNVGEKVKKSRPTNTRRKRKDCGRDRSANRVDAGGTAVLPLHLQHLDLYLSDGVKKVVSLKGDIPYSGVGRYSVRNATLRHELNKMPGRGTVFVGPKKENKTKEAPHKTSARRHR